MSSQSRYVRGDWKCICDACGREKRSGELLQRWDGFMVCAQDWEPRHPQDFVRGVADYQAPPYTRPEQSDVFRTTTYIMGYDGQLFIRAINSISKAMLIVSRIIAKPILSVIQTSVSTLVALYLKKPRSVNTYSVNTTTIG